MSSIKYLLIGLPAILVTSVAIAAPLNPRPGIFNEPPYNRSQPATPTETTPPNQPTEAIQPPLPENQPASATVTLQDGRVSITLTNDTAASIAYQVIGDTNERLLVGKENVTLQDLQTPVTVTFKRQDSGLLNVTPASTEPGTLAVTFTETTDLGTDKSTMRIQDTGNVYLY